MNDLALLHIFSNGLTDGVNALTESEVVLKLVEKINLVILHYNNLDTTTKEKLQSFSDKIDYYMGKGMHTEVVKYLDVLVNDGTLENIINKELFESLNTEIDENTRSILSAITRIDGLDTEIANTKNTLENLKHNSEANFEDIYLSIASTQDKIKVCTDNLDRINGVQYICNNLQDVTKAMELGAKDIVIKSGQYYCTEPIEILDGVSITGSGQVTILCNNALINNIFRNKLDGTESAYNGSGNITIQNITFDGMNTTNGISCIAFGHSKDSSVINCKFRNFNTWHNIEVNGSFNTLIENCQFENYGNNGGNPTEVIQLDYMRETAVYPWLANFDGTVAKQTYINNCTFTNINSQTGAISNHTCYANYVPVGVYINNCTFTNVNSCILLRGWKNVVVTDCNAYGTGCFVGLQNFDSNNNCYCTNVRVDNCFADGENKVANILGTTDGRAIYGFDSNYYSCVYLDISNCRFNNFAGHTIGATCQQWTINNVSINNGALYGIFIFGSMVFSVMNCTIKNCVRDGIAVGGNATINCVDGKVTGNNSTVTVSDVGVLGNTIDISNNR